MNLSNFIFYATVLALLSSCGPSYHAAQLESFVDPEDTSKQKVATYAVTKNNMVIPEYVIDRKGNYPTSEEEALRRFEERRDEFEELVNRKYKTENNFTYQAKKGFFGIGFTLVAPIAIPVIYLSRLGGEEENDEGVIKEYFRNIAREPVPRKPVLRDTLEAI